MRSIRLILDIVSEAHATTAGNITPIRTSQRHLTDSIDLFPPQTRPAVTSELLKLRMRLLPLQQVEEVLLRKMTPAGSAEFEATHLSPMTNVPYRARQGKFKEIAINSTAQWKGAFGRLIATARASLDSAADIDFEDPKDPGVILNACAEDIAKLWNDPIVRALLKAQNIRLESMSGLYVKLLYFAS